MIIKNMTTLISIAEANKLAIALNADIEDDEIYKAFHCPKRTGFSFVAIVDENDNIIYKI